MSKSDLVAAILGKRIFNYLHPTQKKSIETKPFGILGLLLLTVGITVALCALNMDTSVAVDNPMLKKYGFPERVNNIGLMNDKQNYLIFGGILAVVGVFMSFSGIKSEEANASSTTPQSTSIESDNGPISPQQKLIENSTIESHQDKISRLQQLKQMLDAGILTQEEFTEQKSEVLKF